MFSSNIPQQNKPHTVAIKVDAYMPLIWADGPLRWLPAWCTVHELVRQKRGEVGE